MLPLVASAMSAPGFSTPRSYARASTCSAMRSFTLPVRFMCSAFAYRCRRSPRTAYSMAKSGVFPTRLRRPVRRRATWLGSTMAAA